MDNEEYEKYEAQKHREFMEYARQNKEMLFKLVSYNAGRLIKDYLLCRGILQSHNIIKFINLNKQQNLYEKINFTRIKFDFIN